MHYPVIIREEKQNKECDLIISSLEAKIAALSADKEEEEHPE